MNLGFGPGQETGARCKRRGFSPRAATRHSQSAREYMESFSKHLVFVKMCRARMCAQTLHSNQRTPSTSSRRSAPGSQLEVVWPGPVTCMKVTIEYLMCFPGMEIIGIKFAQWNWLCPQFVAIFVADSRQKSRFPTQIAVLCWISNAIFLKSNIKSRKSKITSLNKSLRNCPNRCRQVSKAQCKPEKPAKFQTAVSICQFLCPGMLL